MKAARLLLTLGLYLSACAAGAAEPSIYFVSISINGVERQGFHAALEADGAFSLEVGTYAELGLIEPQGSVETIHGRDFLPLSGLGGLDYQFDSLTLALTITCTPACFPASEISAEWQPLLADPTPLGAYLNYDLVAQKSGSADFAGVVTELGVFTAFGHGATGFTARYIDGVTDFIRLDTTWEIDLPTKRQRWRFGDSVTAVAGWGQPVRFAGVQFGTDHSLQPGFVTFPTPAIRGEASLPSTADIYVNGVQRATVDLEPGPFTIEQPPVITGAGDLRVVMRDLLGRETVLIQPFYASRALLREGLAEYSIELGMLRNGYGLESFDYGAAFATGTYRRGLGQRLTVGIHGEASEQHAGLGPSADWKMPFGGVFSTAVAASMHKGDLGLLAQAELNWSSERFGVQISQEMASSAFYRLGNARGEREARMRTSGNVGFDLWGLGGISLNYTRIDERDTDDFEIVSANYTRHFSGFGTFGVNLSRSFGAYADTAVYVSLTARLGGRATGSASFDRSGGTSTGTLRASQNAPAEGGWGYRAEASRDDSNRGRGAIMYESTKGSASLEVSAIQDKVSARLGARGGLVFMKGDIYTTRFVEGSFALVEVDDFEGVTVYKENRKVATTDNHGRALITGLRPYEENRLSIDPLDLPLSASIGAAALVKVPRRMSGVMAAFPIGRTRAALARIVDHVGQPLPPGTELHALDGGDGFPVGFDGEAYLLGGERKLRFEARMPGGNCVVTVPPVEASTVPVRLGVLTCEGDRP